MRRIDGHVHLVGDGTSGSHCWIRLRTSLHRLQAKAMLRGAGIAVSSLSKDLDQAYPEAISKMIRESTTLDAAVLLAQDIPYDDHGEPMPEMGGFYVPNDYLFEVVSQYPDLFIPAVSIHPGRPDAMDELERCIEKGAKVLKLLPNCLNVDCSNPKFRPFWDKIAEAGIVFLSHTGGEMTLPVIKPEYADPAILKLPLECGVKVIAAHCAGRSGFKDPDYTDDLIEMFDIFPNLYADNSAFSGLNRCRTAKKILESGKLDRIVHGSDFPIPIISYGPFKSGLISKADYREGKKIRNPLERDCFLKAKMGFGPETFTRLDSDLLAH
ncbi:MAG: amidohydrolase family protein [Verrucomicrobiales bacterium]|nr:amidohydrolase family protein [Verrucomicrobiales bacterium]